jgi:Asp-tRNA(Asn)/Glu-tRNA(Gln) amidotransferase A subunit family amidase
LVPTLIDIDNIIMAQENWQSLAQEARDRRDASLNSIEEYFPLPSDSRHLAELPDPLPRNIFPLKKEYLAPSDYNIIETDPIELLVQLKSGKLSAVSVVGAYLRAAVLAHRLLNTVTEFLPELAYEQATRLDAQIAAGDVFLGPLHGLPVSAKDVISFAGRTSNYALAGLVRNSTPKDSAIVTILRDAGAVFYERTTQPQFLMALECESNVYGRTVNPYNSTLVPGGSSGGEGAAVGFHAAPVGIGSDIGGSIRVPAGFCGVYGFKPTVGRLPSKDNFNPMGGAESIKATTGPIGRTLEITQLVTRVILEAKPWRLRPELSAQPFDTDPLAETRELGKLIVGVLRDDGLVEPQPPVRRALEEAIAKLTSAGKIAGLEIKVVDFNPLESETTNHTKIVEILSALYFEDGGETDLSHTTRVGEPLLPMSKAVFEQSALKKLTIEELWALNRQKTDFHTAYNDFWRASGIDVLLAPLHPGSAQPHYSTFSINYSAVWNFLDYPAISFPFTKVDPFKDSVEKNQNYVNTTPRNIFDSFYRTRYTPDLYTDAPVALQLIARRNEDEKLLESLKILEKIFKE